MATEKAPLPSDSSATVESKPKAVPFSETALNPESFTIDGGILNYPPLKALGSGWIADNGMALRDNSTNCDIFGFLRDVNTQMQPLPMAIRSMSVTGNGIDVLVELPPAMRSIYWNAMMKEESKRHPATKITLPFPWIQLRLHISLLKMSDGRGKPRIAPHKANVLSYFFADSPIGPRYRPDKKLYHPSLPNMFDDTSMCFDFTYEQGQRDWTMGEIISQAVTDFWGTTYNLNLSGAYRRAAEIVPKDFKTAKTSEETEPKNRYAAPKNRYAARKATEGVVFEKYYEWWSQFSLLEMLELEERGLPVVSRESDTYLNGNGTLVSGFAAGAFVRPLLNNNSLKRTNVKAADKSGRLVSVDDADVAKVSEVASALTKMSALKAVVSPRNYGYYSDKNDVTEGQSYKGVIVGFDKKPTIKIAQAKSLRPPRKTMTADGTATKTQPAETFTVTPKGLDESIDLLVEKLHTGKHPLPPGMRFWDPIRQLIVFERPPGVRKLTYYPAEKDRAKTIKASRKKQFKLWVPWTQYWVSYSAKRVINVMWVTTSSKSMSHGQISLGILPLPNVYNDSRICTPNNLDKASDFTELVSVAYNAIWNSNYNQDLMDAIRHFAHNLPEMVTNWGVKEREDYYSFVLRGAGGEGNQDIAFLNWWSRQSPVKLMEYFSMIPPISPHSVLDDDRGCECGECEDGIYCISEEDARRTMTASAMLQHVQSNTMMPTLGALYTTIHSTYETTYDKILKHAQAYESKALY